MQTLFSDDDYREYLSLIVEGCGQAGSRIWAHCRTPNHADLIVVPETARPEHGRSAGPHVVVRSSG